MIERTPLLALSQQAHLRACAALLLWTVIGCAAGGETGPLHTIPDSKKVVLLVLEFENRTPEGARWDPWKLGIPSLIEGDLVLAGYFSVVSEESRRRALQEAALGRTGLVHEPRALGRLLGAQWLLGGDFAVQGTDMSISCRFIEVDTARVLGSRQEVGPVSAFFALAKAASLGLMKQVKIDLDASDVRIITEAVETRSVDASLANYNGELAVREMERLRALERAGRAPAGVRDQLKRLRDDARGEFRRATGADPSYERAKRNLGRLTLQFPSSI